MKKHTVAVNEFVRRQVKGSGQSFTDKHTFKDIAQHAGKRLAAGDYSKGYRDGVIIVIADKEFAKDFVCPLVKIFGDTPLIARLIQRQEGEEAYIQIRAEAGELLVAERLELILYSHDVLVENNEQSSNAAWELVSFHALPEEVKKMPMNPVTMMRNQLRLHGGTAASYDSEEWAESVQFWQKYAALDQAE
ncbi:MAG: DUF3228 family protein [Candidatus Neomarinimicrobiota bacterium]